MVVNGEMATNECDNMTNKLGAVGVDESSSSELFEMAKKVVGR